MAFRSTLILRALALSLLLALPAAAAPPPDMPKDYVKAQYDEDLVPKFTLPDPLVLNSGRRVRTAAEWTRLRRPELLQLFQTEVYGRTPIGRPPGERWEVLSVDRNAMGGRAIYEKVRVYLLGRADGPKLDLDITLPKSRKRVPVFVMLSWHSKVEPQVIERGYGVALYDPTQLYPDKRDVPWEGSLRQQLAPPGQAGPRDDDWGALGVWAWGASRVVDYLETDPLVNRHEIMVLGVSRYGKTAGWAGAQDTRFAITFPVVSGTGGATLVRRGYGETVKAITDVFPYWFDKRFATYASHVNDLPVDWHELIALMAPRPVYIATAERDWWTDQHGQFLAAKNAAPVYALFGEKGMGVDEEPPIESPVGDYIGWHKRHGVHGLTPYDWARFMDFADRHFHRS
jgi:hypothetical protein